MKRIKIKFVDFYGNFNKQDNEFLDVLNERYEVVQCDEPDYIIYSGFGYEHLHYDCIRIFFTGECQTPDFNECDYAIGLTACSLATAMLAFRSTTSFNISRNTRVC